MFTPQPYDEDDDEEYTVVPAIPYEDYPEHNNSGFCGNMPHECHENPESIADLNNAIQEGEITVEDADRIFRGKTII